MILVLIAGIACFALTGLQVMRGRMLAERDRRFALEAARSSAMGTTAEVGAAPKEWLSAFQATLPDSYPNQANPVVVAVPETRDAIGAAIVAVIEGQDAKDAAERAQKSVAEIIKKTQ